MPLVPPVDTHNREWIQAIAFVSESLHFLAHILLFQLHISTLQLHKLW